MAQNEPLCWHKTNRYAGTKRTVILAQIEPKYLAQNDPLYPTIETKVLCSRSLGAIILEQSAVKACPAQQGNTDIHQDFFK